MTNGGQLPDTTTPPGDGEGPPERIEDATARERRALDPDVHVIQSDVAPFAVGPREDAPASDGNG